MRHAARFPLAALVAALFALLPLASRPARAQDVATAVRFEIAETGDSTFSFFVGGNRWVQRGQRGMTVDPRRRDVLVARFVVLRVASGRATALVTGATSPVSDQHIALLDRPTQPWYRRSEFWWGAILGAAVGLGAGAAF